MKVLITALATDDRATLAQQLATQQLEFLGILEHLSDVLVITTPEGVVLYANRQAGRSLSSSAGELVGRSLFDLAAERSLQAVRSLFDARAEGTAPTDVLLQGLEQARCILEVNLVRDIDFEGEAAVLVVGHDVTERRRIERQLELTERLSSLGTLAAGMAHEINNPLAFVTSNLEFFQSCLEEVGPKLEDALHQDVRLALAEALVGVSRIRDIVRDLKLFSRTEDGPDRTGEVGAAVEWALKLARPVLQRYAVEKDLRPTPPVRGSDARLSQVVLNLLTNASDAVATRGAEGWVRVSAATDELGRAVVDVEDNGCGMPAERLAHVFEPFYTTKPVGRGTGLGLSVSLGIVRGMGGTLEVRSEEGVGTRFRITLPSAEDTQALPSGPAPTPVPRRLRMFVIDDEPQVVSSLVRMLASRHDVEGTSDPAGGLERLCQGEPFDVVLCDVMMPRLDGVTLFQRAVTSSPRLATRFIFLTGGLLSEDVREAVARLQRPLLHKPFRSEELEGLLRKVT